MSDTMTRDEFIEIKIHDLKNIFINQNLKNSGLGKSSAIVGGAEKLIADALSQNRSDCRIFEVGISDEKLATVDSGVEYKHGEFI